VRTRKPAKLAVNPGKLIIAKITLQRNAYPHIVNDLLLATHPPKLDK